MIGDSVNLGPCPECCEPRDCHPCGHCCIPHRIIATITGVTGQHVFGDATDWANNDISAALVNAEHELVWNGSQWTKQIDLTGLVEGQDEGSHPYIQIVGSCQDGAWILVQASSYNIDTSEGSNQSGLFFNNTGDHADTSAACEMPYTVNGDAATTSTTGGGGGQCVIEWNPDLCGWECQHMEYGDQCVCIRCIDGACDTCTGPDDPACSPEF